MSTQIEWAVYDSFANHWGTVQADSEMSALAQFNDSDDTWRAIPATDIPTGPGTRLGPEEARALLNELQAGDAAQ
jgi:hypothetical protein